ncbi:sodium-dependent nutrient amino acid transporter 1 isoform X1 [Drosophila albomicans]|uniref:Transporter n=1 Tax=Drosophila albomicans TaxID=7291 RepID=A0A6P8W123_DROAB|nr:sodium-dependent nutrient amino acid transporter 1 isoform X1 [Drosophila albomicans]XP_034097314.1 sodium-dependent nutrient amino acid transporter 1 isoform X1 [Drosophila albomicans]XP_034097315.1 sodium-dependent nutrient amino acid transporter 1 isoform X1 [Drosophila albomicans]XP_034097319.1 sodium-dependent nutrient amino acid transporter 1 isoform X1 [Drosophila albomicans]
MKSLQQNPAFVGDDGHSTTSTLAMSSLPGQPAETRDDAEHAAGKTPTGQNERDTWGKGVEFLMSCIAMSVGLGNVWRFPFTALDNGGGAFLIPYLIVLFLIGKPIYYLEMVIGQFSSRGSVKVFDLCPAMKGVGIGQVISISFVTTYYVGIMGITLCYFYDSFRTPLPWSECRPDWGTHCVASSQSNTSISSSLDFSPAWSTPSSSSSSPQEQQQLVASAELYFLKEVLREKDQIADGIGLPNWELVIGLFVSWTCVFLIIRRGVKSSGKASYFLALFPYVIMGVLLVRAVTLPGSLDGIYYFIKPNWEKILDPKVWYAAVTQCFYSLSVCFGNIIMYSSFNKFGHNVHRDATIVTALDTATSLLAGFTIFGILGHLAHEIGTEDIGKVVKGGAGLAFISYPDAIAKFKQLPQIFSVLFFLMLFVLGIGSNIAMTSCTVTAIRDRFPNFKQWQCSLLIAVVSFLIGLMYITPGGQYMLTLVDFFGASMIALVLGIAELYTIGWIYGTDRLCKDIEFMLGRKVGLYWRLCWGVFTPLIMTVILIYFYATYEPLTYNNQYYPAWAYGVGWCITAFGIVQLPIWMIVAIIREPGSTLGEKVRGAFRPKKNWGPMDPLLREQYNKEIQHELIPKRGRGFWASIRQNIFG